MRNPRIFTECDKKSMVIALERREAYYIFLVSEEEHNIYLEMKRNNAHVWQVFNYVVTVGTVVSVNVSMSEHSRDLEAITGSEPPKFGFHFTTKSYAEIMSIIKKGASNG